VSRRRRSSYYNFYMDFEPGRPIETQDGIKAMSQRGAFAKNWWATRWIVAMERLVDTGRLSRGRSYARKGQVLSIEETKGGVKARVQGSRTKPYTVTIEVASLSDAQWDSVIESLAEQALFAAQLLAGEMPQEIERAFETAGVSLFPARRGDLLTHCSCPDYANPCKHVAATHYILGERFDEDPFLLFRLRGRTQEQILMKLRQRRAGDELADDEENIADEDEVIVLLEEVLAEENGAARFWGLRQPLEEFSVNIRPPQVELPLLKRLGDPAFVPSPGLRAHLGAAMSAISSMGLKLAFEEDPGQP
jgi:uncharacterized Zn finger protein